MRKKVICHYWLLTASLGVGLCSFAQGAWNIRYVPINSVTSNFIGQDIRIDFASSQYDTISQPFNVRRLLSGKDTESLEVDNKIQQFRESWHLYVDDGEMGKQYLECLSEPEITIKEMLLQSISDSDLTVLATIHKNEYSSSRLITIPKKYVKGILVDGVKMEKDAKTKTADSLMRMTAFLNDLKEHSTFKLHYTSLGCFVHYYVNANIFKTSTGYYAKIIYRRDESAMDYKPVVRKTIKLPQAKFDLLKQLEQNLIAMQREFDATNLPVGNAFCTWGTVYEMMVGNMKKTYYDIRCAMDHTLLLRLFGLKLLSISDNN